MTNEQQPQLIGLGAHVEIELIDENGQREGMEFDIVEEKYADLSRGRLGVNTPLAKALRGQRAGDEIPYAMGDIRRVRVLAVSRVDLAGLDDVKERREEVLRKAIAAAQRTDAEVFAASFSGKWGDYDMSDVAEDDDR